MSQLERVSHQAAASRSRSQRGTDSIGANAATPGHLRRRRDDELPPEDRAGLDRLGRVEVGPRQGGPEDVDLGRVGVCPSLLREGEHGGGGAAVGEFGGGHASV